MSIDKQLDDIVEQIKEHINKYKRSCLGCNSFDESTETCKMFKQRPPARIIAFGCEHFDDEIPF